MPCPTDLPRNLTALMPGLMRLARYLSGNREDAQDLTQEVLLKLWARLQAGDRIDDLQSYARAALRNQYRQVLRERMPDGTAAETADLTAPDGLDRLLLKELGDAIGRLPPDQARLMRLVAGGETSPLALAQITGAPVGTVMSRLARARARLRQEMEE